MGRALSILAILALAACGKVFSKVPIVDIEAGFTLADISWFEAEETLFVFYRVEAQQGIGPESQLELSYRTDDVELPWTPLDQLTPVHTHVPVDCGVNTKCGSLSLHVTKAPTRVALQLRYHRDGAMTLPATVTYNIVGLGPPHLSRSLLVYGVFDESNNRMQWRARHQFPTLRNQQVQDLGLRRWFKVADPAYGDLGPVVLENPYGYGLADSCPPGLAALGFGPLETTERAIFDSNTLPLSASTSPAVCARATTTDAKGTFETMTIARRNPEVRAAFPSLRSPIKNDTPVGFLLKPCQRVISDQHLAMQQQRLLLQDPVEVCLDNWTNPNFSTNLAGTIRSRVDQVRAQGNDMVVTVALHHDDTSGRLAGAVEQALLQVLPFERDKSSPRVSGAFVFDSYGYTITHAELGRLALWCPAKRPDDLSQVTGASLQSCPLQSDIPDLTLGPFRFNQLPILPSRAQYLNFIGKYSEASAGKMRELNFLAPERTPISENFAIGDFGVATFFNNETLTAAPTDSFSYCAGDQRASLVVFRTSLVPGPMPLSALPDFHAKAHLTAYGLGLAWDFPFLVRATYEVVLAGAASAFSLTVPFGISADNNAYYGTPLWQSGDFPLTETLLQCSRFCDHPTFDSAGVYNVTAFFDPGYRNQCYRPRYPVPSDGGFPLDP